MRFLITGTAGFIGFHVAHRLLREGHTVVGYDGMTPYYDVQLKHDRHAILSGFDGFTSVTAMLEDMPALERAGELAAPDVILHLAAQAGVRYSLENPRSYIDSNIVGSFNVLELAHVLKPRHLLLASTSSAYGANEKMPFEENDKADHPITIYAATKKAMETMAHSYAHLWKIPTTCFRFFTVYGPWGRPDMALFKFVHAMQNDQPIEIYGNGQMKRDFTFIDDLVEAVTRLIECVPQEGQPISELDTVSPAAPWRLVNIAGGEPVQLMKFIEIIEACMGKPALRKLLPMQKGDVVATFADHRLLEKLTGFRPRIAVDKGVPAFVKWYLDRYCENSHEKKVDLFKTSVGSI